MDAYQPHVTADKLDDLYSCSAERRVRVVGSTPACIRGLRSPIVTLRGVLTHRAQTQSKVASPMAVAVARRILCIGSASPSPPHRTSNTGFRDGDVTANCQDGGIDVLLPLR